MAAVFMGRPFEVPERCRMTEEMAGGPVKEDNVVHNSQIDLLCDALNNSRGPDQKRIAEVGLQVICTLLKKNADYGGSAWQSPVLCPHLPPRTGILVRLSDKIRRFGNLLAKGKGEVDDEPLEATMLDFTGYSILWLAYPGEADEVPPVRVDQPRTDCDAGSCDCC